MLRPTLTAASAALGLALGSCSPEPQPVTHVGDQAELGDEAVWTYAVVGADGSPVSVGVRFGAALLDSLPAEPDGTAPCFDADGDGTMDPRAECFIMQRRDLSLPALAAGSTAPFQWVQFNWNYEGHPPPAPRVFAEAHFDFHFYAVSPEVVEGFRAGTCGMMMDCEVYERAVIPVPEKYMPVDYMDLGAVAAEEGNHLLDSTAPELGDPPAPFTQTFIYGSYDGHIVFYEPMMSLAYLQSQPDACFPLKLPEAWKVDGFYPTEYCIRFLPDEGDYTVSLEGFVRRGAA